MQKLSAPGGGGDGDELELFRLAGGRRNLPPPVESPCDVPVRG
ncbi:hypothetical protein [Methylococcus geothermalis]|nr:hypothetical protein [Methylococcus geothermalis]